jgi:serpin B
MRKPSALAAALTVAALGMAGCGTAHVVSGPPLIGKPAARMPAVSPRPYGAADLRFGLDLLGAWCQSQPRANIVFSPASLAAGLGLAYLGARDQTATAMARTLHLPAMDRAEAGMRARQAALGGLDTSGVTVAGYSPMPCT